MKENAEKFQRLLESTSEVYGEALQKLAGGEEDAEDEGESSKDN